MKIVLTGGHFSPALCVIESLPKDIEAFFIGRKNSFEGDKSPTLEYQTIASTSVPFIDIPSARLQRKFTAYTISSLLKLPYGFGKAMKTLRKIKPDVVLGFGGYVSLPVAFAAYFLNIPVVIHEQTLGVGTSNKIISRWARMICISWESSKDFFPGKNVILTGNPVRKEIINAANTVTADKQTIYITGGSSGSHFINSLVEGCLGKLLEKYNVVHQTGDSKKFNDFERLSEHKKSLPEQLARKYRVEKFISSKEAGAVLQKATIVVGRAGMNTVTELMFLEKPCLLIPLPISAKGEQLQNAAFIKEKGLAQVLEQNEATPEVFFSKIKYMMENIDKYKLNSEASNLIEKKAAEHIISVVEDVAQKKD